MSFKGALCASLEVYAVFCMHVHPLWGKGLNVSSDLQRDMWYTRTQLKATLCIQGNIPKSFGILCQLYNQQEKEPLKGDTIMDTDGTLSSINVRMLSNPAFHVTSCCLLFGFLFLFESLASVEQYIFSPQCAGKDVKALVDTGCQYNLISSACVDRLG